jgi:hypothetical protein
VRELIVPGRFCGPPNSGNGGWTAGALAGLVDHDVPADHAARWPTIAVSLRKPPPLDTPLEVTDDGNLTVAALDGEVVARAEIVPDPPVTVDPVPAEEARAAEASYGGLRHHPFPTCFVCGPEREEGDGLRIFPGPVSGRTDEAAPVRVAATWTPHQSHAEDWHTYVDSHRLASQPVTWSALDCVGGWAADFTARTMVLARITVRVEALPSVGQEHVVVGETRGAEGRKHWTAATLYDSAGRALATAEHLWIAVDPAAFG